MFIFAASDFSLEGKVHHNFEFVGNKRDQTSNSDDEILAQSS